jgi:hypothetical protein
VVALQQGPQAQEVLWGVLAAQAWQGARLGSTVLEVAYVPVRGLGAQDTWSLVAAEKGDVPGRKDGAEECSLEGVAGRNWAEVGGRKAGACGRVPRVHALVMAERVGLRLSLPRAYAMTDVSVCRERD